MLAIAETRLPHRRHAATLPSQVHPPVTTPTSVSFDLDVTVGTFRLRVAHQAASHRIAILGPSGAGKSITLRAIAGFLGPAAGTVRFNSDLVSRVPVEARHLGYVPQGLALFPDRTVWQQVLFATGADPALAAWWLRTLHLEDLRDRLPGQISGGQRQRVALARALAHQPRLVLLDEPFNALDAPVRDELRRELRRLQAQTGLSTVLVTHDPEEAALLADEILVIDEGRLLQAGPRAEVFNRPASPQVARLLGIPNLSPGTVAEPGAITRRHAPDLRANRRPCPGQRDPVDHPPGPHHDQRPRRLPLHSRGRRRHRHHDDANRPALRGPRQPRASHPDHRPGHPGTRRPLPSAPRPRHHHPVARRPFPLRSANPLRRRGLRASSRTGPFLRPHRTGQPKGAMAHRPPSPGSPGADNSKN